MRRADARRACREGALTRSRAPPPPPPSAPRVKVLLRKIEAEGCQLSENPVRCEDVFGSMSVGGAYDTSRKAVVMNPAAPVQFLQQSEWTRAVSHELVHAFDDCRARVDWSNCRHIACTEVRAANLSGDCDFSTEMGRRPMSMLGDSWAGHQQACVRRRAEISLRAHEQCAPDARLTLESVWDDCYRDYAPFSTN